MTTNTRTDTADALAEVLAHVATYAALPSAHLPISPLLSFAESVAVDRGYVATGALTEKGRLWLAQWAEGMSNA